jgi:hypothetical protein
MLRLIARQSTRNLVKCSNLTRFALRQKHIPASMQSAVTNNRQGTIQDSKDVVVPILDRQSTQFVEIIESTERLVELPLINIGDYVEAFR